MIQEFINDPLNKAWPFWVLGLSPECSNQEINKASQLITSKLSLGVPDADVFDTPAGTKSRDDFLVREAKSILDDPAQRLSAEFWYVPPQVSTAASADQESDSAQPKVLSVKQWLITLGLKWAV